MDYRPALRCAEDAACAAGFLLRTDFSRANGPRGSGSHADADDDAEELIRQTLLDAFPDWGYRGEETTTDKPPGPDGHMWIVDPNDGTSSYLRGFRGAAVSIALLRKGVPILGVVYAHTAPDHDGDLFAWAEGCGPLRRSRPTSPEGSDLVLLANGADRKALANAKLLGNIRFIALPSIAYRLALVAAGEAAATISLSSPQDWDYAAGHALLLGANRVLVNERGEDVTYTERGASRVGWCFAGRPDLAHRLVGLDWASVLKAQRESPNPRSPFPLDSQSLIRPGGLIEDGPLLRRAQGCLLGQLAGYSLGSLVEFDSAQGIERRYPGGPNRLSDGGTWNTIAGQPTDDSEMALMLARSIVRAGKYDTEETANAYVHWFRSHPFDIGGTTAQALRALDARSTSEPAWSVAARSASQSSQANGSLMRISPLAILGSTLDDDEVAALARADSDLTHPHGTCGDAVAAFALATAYAIRTGCTPGECWEHTLRWCNADEKFDVSVVTALEKSADAAPSDFVTHAGWVLVAFQNAFFELLHASSFEEAVVRTVRRGGDTDTNAAICGALLGAVYGRDAVPQQWRDQVLSCRPMRSVPGVARPRPREFWPCDALTLAEQLLLAGKRPSAV